MPREPAGCLFGFLANLFGIVPPPVQNLPATVMVNKFFITEAEQSFFKVLQLVVEDRAHILAQISLRQLFYFPNAPGRQT
jgi:hypothetical protein